MAATSSSGALSFVRYPDAPARRSRTAYLIFGVDAEDEHRQLRLHQPEFLQRVQPVLARHRKVQQDDIAPPGPHELEHVMSRCRLADDSHIRVLGHDALEAFADHGVIVGNEDPNHPPHLSLCGQ